MDKFVSREIKRINLRIPHDLYESFKKQCYTEGYSMQKALLLLIDKYTNSKEF